MHDAHLSWVTEPWYMRIFLLYLFAIACVAIVHVSKLVSLLYWFAFRKRFSVADIHGGTATRDVIARAALASRIVYLPDVEKDRNTKLTQCTIAKDMCPRFLRLVDHKVIYLYERCWVNIRTIRHLALLTLLLSFLIVVYGAFSTFSDESNNRNIPGSLALANAMFLSFARLGLGITVATVLYAMSSFLERVLMYRKIAWTYFYSRSINELSEK